jgi:hypothetical protein
MALSPPPYLTPGRAIAEIYPPYARYQRQTDRQIPVVVLGPVEG